MLLLLGANLIAIFCYKNLKWQTYLRHPCLVLLNEPALQKLISISKEVKRKMRVILQSTIILTYLTQSLIGKFLDRDFMKKGIVISYL